MNTSAIQNTLNAAHSAGGGTVVIPASANGSYLSGPLTFYSNINLQIDGELQMLAYGTYPATASFITGSRLTNVEVSGTGSIDGQGSPWWAAFNANNSIVRPYGMIEFTTCTYVEVTGITLTNPPNTHLDFESVCSNVTVNGITINTPVSPNTDGIDMSASTALVENCSISDGDDNIAIGGTGSQLSTNISVINNAFGIGHGMSIGSYTSGGVNGLTVNNDTFNATTTGIRLKSERGRGGLVQNLTFSNLTMTNVQYPININSYYNQGSVPTTPQDIPQPYNSSTGTPNWQNITISNVTSTDTASNSYCGIIWGLPELPVENIALSNVKISAHYGFDLDHVRNIHFDSLCAITPTSGGTFISTTSAPTPYDAVYWSDQDINSPAVAGNTVYSLNGTYNISGGGAVIGGTNDQFNFESTPSTGDAIIVANLTSQTSTTTGEAGVMIRASNSSGATFAAVLLDPSGGVSFITRSGTIATTTATGPASWVTVARSGSNFMAYYGSNGTSWTQLGSTAVVTMSGSVLAGLAVTSGTNSATAPLNSAVFSSVELLEATTTAFPTTAAINTSSTTLTVFASDALNDPAVTYTWSASTIPAGAVAPTYSPNGSNVSNYTTVTFTQPGTYAFTVTAKSASGLVVTSTTANVVVSIPLTNIVGTNGADTISLVRSGTLLNIYVNNTTAPSYSETYATAAALTIDGNGGADAITLNFSGGNPLPAAGLSLINTGGSTAISIVGTSGSDTAVIGAATTTFDGAAFTYSNASSISLNISESLSASITQAQAGGPALSLIGSTASDALVISAGSFTIPAPSTGAGIVPYRLSSLNISSGAKVALHTAAAATDRTVLVLGGLAIGSSGQLDIGGNDMLIHLGSLPAISMLLSQGYSGGTWLGGAGITSSMAANDTTHLTAVAAIQNSVDGTTSGPVLYNTGSALGAFDGQAGVDTDVLVRYTYYGDANLDGSVNGSDYSRIDSAYQTDSINPNAFSGWYNGDFNYDGSIDGSDYTLIDNAFNQQGLARPAGLIAKTAASLASTTAAIGVADAISIPVAIKNPATGWMILVASELRSNTKCSGFFRSDVNFESNHLNQIVRRHIHVRRDTNQSKDDCSGDQLQALHA